MATETTARAQQPQPDVPDENDYQAFCEALSASARGRTFLAEYARRNRNADTEQLLEAIERLQSLVTATATPPTAEPVKQELLALLDNISAAQRELEDSILAIRVTKFAELIALVERRIAIIVARRAEPLPQVEAAISIGNSPNKPADEVERTHLAVVPPPEQPELPIPSPAATQPPTIALVRSETIMAEVAFVEPTTAHHARHEPNAIELPTETETASSAAFETQPTPTPPPANPLASIMALSEEERLALFT